MSKEKEELDYSYPLRMKKETNQMAMICCGLWNVSNGTTKSKAAFIREAIEEKCARVLKNIRIE